MRCKSFLVAISLGLVFVGQVVGQEHRVTGEVISGETRAPLLGVNIAVQNTDMGTTTDLYGQYVLDGVSPQDILTFTYYRLSG